MMETLLPNLSQAIAETVEAASNGVVQVEARSRVSASGVVWSDDGVIVTAHHVVERDENIRVGLPDGSSVRAKLIGRDPSTDLAVLKAETTGLAHPAWVGPESLKVGHLVLGLGRPGRTIRATMGIVGVLGESWRTPMGGRLDRYLQSDVVMYPGFSGGPLVDASGQVLGINSSALARGVAITVPTPTIQRVVEAVLANGRVRWGYLGVGAQPVALPSTIGEQLKQETGLLLVSVEDEGPAARSGLLLGDTIVELAGQPVRHLDDLQGLLDGDRVGTTVPIKVLRAGAIHEITVVVGERP